MRDSNRRWGLRLIGSLLLLWACHERVQAAMSINLPLDDPDYALLEKLVHSHWTSTHALTIKPITRLYAAQLVAEAIEQRRQEWETSQRQEPFLDQVLEHLSSRLKRELQQLGFLYRPRRADPWVFAPLSELQFDVVVAHDPFILRDRSGLTSNLQGVFSRNEGFAYGDDLSLRTRSRSWATLWDHLAVYIEPEAIIRTDPVLGEMFDVGLHKGYAKAGYANLELEVGRDTVAWGPGFHGDLVISNNAPPLNLLKASTPLPFRLPWLFREAGQWQIAYFVARLGADRPIAHALVSGLRITLQPTSYLTFGYTNALQAFGSGGVSLAPLDFLAHTFVPALDATGRSVNGVAAYDVTLTLPLVRTFTLLKGVKFYWQRGHNNTTQAAGLLGGGNLLGGLLDGGRWDVRFEFAETRSPGPVWYTHPTYSSGFAFKQFFLGHPIGGAAQGFFARATYYLTPTTWVAADARHEQYGFGTALPEATQQRFGLEASYPLPLGEGRLTLRGRLEYATLEESSRPTRSTGNGHLSAHWRF